MTNYDYKNKVWNTSRSSRYSALCIDNVNVALYEGRMFRSWLEVSLAHGIKTAIKLHSPIKFAILEQRLQVCSGAIRMEVLWLPTVGGNFNTSLPIIEMNATDERPIPIYTTQLSLTNGGTAVGGTVVEVMRLRTSGPAQQASSLGDTVTTMRLCPPGDYYFVFEGKDAQTSEGMYSILWEERP